MRSRAPFPATFGAFSFRGLGSGIRASGAKGFAVVEGLCDVGMGAWLQAPEFGL